MGNFLREKFYYLIALYAGTIFVSNDMFLPALTPIKDDMHTTIGTVQLAVSTFMAGCLLVQVFLGPISDKYGRKNIVIGAGIVFVIATFMCGSTSNITALLIARLFSGSAMAAIGAAGLSAMNEHYATKDSVKAMASITNVSMLAPLLGPIIGAYILQYTNNWRNIFHYDSGVMVVVLILIAIYMPETNPDVLARRAKAKKVKIDATSDQIKDATSHAKKAPLEPISLLSKFRGMASLLRDKTLMMYSISSGLLNLVFMFWIAGAPVLMANIGLTPREYSLWQAPVFIGLLLGNNIAVLVMGKLGLLKTINMTFVSVFFVGFLFIICSYFLPTSPLGLIIPMGLLLFFRGLQNAPLNQFILSMTDSHKGSAASLLGMTGALGGTFGTLLASSMSQSTNMASMFVFLITLTIMFICSLLSYKWYKQKQALKAQHHAELLQSYLN